MPAELVYLGDQDGLPNQDTSTWIGLGWGTSEAFDDTPEHVVSGWVNYTVPKNVLKGLTLGFGGSWESEREYRLPITSSGRKTK